MEMVCPDCGEDVPVIDTKIVGRNVVTTGHCIEDGEVEVVE